VHRSVRLVTFFILVFAFAIPAAPRSIPAMTPTAPGTSTPSQPTTSMSPARRLSFAVAACALALVATAQAGVLPGAAAATPQQDRAVQAAVDRLPAYVRQVMRTTGVPGVAVAVVHRDRLVYAGGFGVRDVVRGGAVTPSTVFQVASVSKPLGASAVAAAVGRGRVSWDTPVAPLVPGFTVADPWVTSTVTIGDLYAHRSGLPGQYGNDLESLGFDRQTIFARTRLESLAPFRITYDYSNFGLTAGGVAAANAEGTDWNTFARRNIFGPLGMRRSTFSHAQLERTTNVARLHQRAGGRWIPGPVRDADAQAPAGGASSTVLDISRWMRMMLAGGTFGGRRVVAQDALAPMLSLQIRTSPSPLGRIGGYGFGMEVSLADGASVTWSHSGAFTNGAATQVHMVPDLDLGIVTLTNGWPIGVPEAISATFDDWVRNGRSTQDWLAVTRAAFASYTTPTYAIDGQRRPANPAPARALDDYVGTYANAYVGTGQVSRDSRGLVLALGPDGGVRIRLTHWSGDVFFHNGPGMPAGFYEAVRFGPSGSGPAQSLSTDMINAGMGVLTRLS